MADPASTNAVILAAGMGTRMMSAMPKVMHPVAGRPMVRHVMAMLEQAGAETIITVVGPGMDEVVHETRPHPAAVQTERLGTAHAVLAAKDLIAAAPADTLLVLFGDTPLIRPETISRMLARRASPDAPGVVVLGFEPEDPGAYGRLITGPGGNLEKIVEAKDASADELAVGLCNSGVMAIDGKKVLDWLGRIGDANAKKEFYLTDIIETAIRDGAHAAVVMGDADEVLGVNSRTDLAAAEAAMQDRLRAHAMAGGATLTDPGSVFFSWDTVLGRDVSVGPNVVFGAGVTVGDDVTIRAFCHIEGAAIGPGAIVGPFARLRPGTVLERNVHIGNFVEVKASVMGEGAKANHLTYIGDSEVGAGANMGAGTITCNYDGHFKSKTVIGRGAFIGSNTALVAPVTIGDGAIIGAGSAIVKDVAADALAVTRAKQAEVQGWAKRFNTKRGAEKAAAKARKEDT
ncbi:MAG: bifunctional UDP-N-acetylglucosamine diphosphorylase/glucosamine-1-phosphate N-acetyltransferase GlmU [Rhodospirillaceae bacterium]